MPMLVTEAGMVIFSIWQLPKASSPMMVRLPGSTGSPVFAAGQVISVVRLLSYRIPSTEQSQGFSSATRISLRAEQAQKLLQPTVFTPLGSRISSSLPQPPKAK